MKKSLLMISTAAFLLFGGFGAINSTTDTSKGHQPTSHIAYDPLPPVYSAKSVEVAVDPLPPVYSGAGVNVKKDPLPPVY
ncbi:hypothetical protein LCL96_18345 [Rossellomorea aquimaris]|uniref:hypothetical protein n=1 Tax=Rossellomorea aquimaris TaxID=189382 RepID=UPI001CD3F362|nr:hypothetical protein [Rossellomorea aquimaris]MCA1060879.1 hypothetical protein [Rossellomorea aquimaris]